MSPKVTRTTRSATICNRSDNKSFSLTQIRDKSRAAEHLFHSCCLSVLITDADDAEDEMNALQHPPPYLQSQSITRFPLFASHSEKIVKLESFLVPVTKSRLMMALQMNQYPGSQNLTPTATATSTFLFLWFQLYFLLPSPLPTSFMISKPTF